MPTDPNISLQVRPLQVEDPMDSYGKVLSIRHMIQQGQLGLQQQQMNAEKLRQEKRANQLADEDAADVEKMKQAYASAGGKPEETIQAAIKLGVGPKAIQATQQHFADYAAKIAKTHSDELPVQKDRDERMLAVHDQAIQMLTENPQAFATNYPQLYAAAVKIDPDAKNHLDPNTPPTLDQLKMSQLGYVTHLSFLGQEDEKRKRATAAADAVKEADRVKREPSLLAESQAKADTAQLQNAAQQLGAATDQAGYSTVWNGLPAAMASRFPQPGAYDPKTTPAQVRQLGMSSEQQTQAVQASANAAETAHQHQQTNTNEQARIRLEEAKNAREQAIYNQTYGEGANPALVGVPANLRTQALSQAQKAATEYLTGARIADDMESLIQMTRAGNKAAGSNLPLVGVETINALNGIKRINRSEIDQYAGAGSLLDKIQGKIGKLAVGQPIPKDVLDDIEKMHKTLRENADKGYDDKLAGINQNYKSNFTRVKTSSAPAAKITVTDPNGGTHVFDSQLKADAFKKAAGIN